MTDNRLSFNGIRFGGTSWVVNGGFEENLRVLSKDVSDMEIVLFETPKLSNIPQKDEIKRLKDTAGELGMTCTVHFPKDIRVTHDSRERIKSEDACLRIMELFKPLEPFAWVMHIVGEIRGVSPSQDIEKWREGAAFALSRFKENIDNPRKICVETLDYDFSCIFDLVAHFDFSVCLDIGHLVKYKYPVRCMFNKYLPFTRVFHIHGVKEDGTDHSDMTYFDKRLFYELLSQCTDNTERVMTLEVFAEDYQKSINAIKNMYTAEHMQLSIF